MTEAMISGTQLHNDILDGNAEKLKNMCCKSNLPTINKNHIFDGLDVSFIDRDILKKVLTVSRAPDFWTRKPSLGAGVAFLGH